jgi:hypothetical protein
MKPIVADIGLVGRCGLYCGACRAYRRGRCGGCHENQKAAWCGVRTCCGQNGYASCADCKTFPDPAACKKFNNVIAKIFGWIFRSDRRACILQIHSEGLQAHAEKMAASECQTIKRGGP